MLRPLSGALLAHMCSSTSLPTGPAGQTQRALHGTGAMRLRGEGELLRGLLGGGEWGAVPELETGANTPRACQGRTCPCHTASGHPQEEVGPVLAAKT